MNTLEVKNKIIIENDSSQLYAAVDLGSNSFHMVISRYDNGEFIVLDRHKETVRLASGLDDSNNLSDLVKDRALNCLQQFKQLLQNVPETNIRAVGTNAMRNMTNSLVFIDLAEKALGSPIEIIAGREEARLIYLGVIKGVEFGSANRLVVDIGGGSTEVIVGSSEDPLRRESLEMGCVVISDKYFANGELTTETFDTAVVACKLIIQPIVRLFKEQGWQYSLGCSGTIRAISSMLDGMSWASGEVTLSALRKLRDFAVEAETIDQLELPELNGDRRPVFGGGLSILLALFESFEIDNMRVSDRALRDGVLHDLVGRESDSDARLIAVAGVMQRCSVDARHAKHVSHTALRLYQATAVNWGLDQPRIKKMLSWAAQLHEVGMLIGHDGYHKHGAYMLQNADMVGFGRRDQMLIAALVRGHRRKFPVSVFENLPASVITPAKRIAVLLRLSVLLHRTRSIRLPEEMRIEAQGDKLQLTFPDTWLKQHPLTLADLHQEKKWISVIGIELSFV